MKSKIVKVLSSAVLCGVLAVSVLPVEPMAAEQGCSHPDAYEVGWSRDCACLEAFHHRVTETTTYYCPNCGDRYDYEKVYDESHDMNWIDYDAGILRCECGYEERWQ